jgi:GNAT superfamily N-acetyltransferase
MGKQSAPSYRIEPLNSNHNKSNFICGVKILDTYLKKQASQEMRKHISATFVLLEAATNKLAGYYTLAATSILASGLPIDISKKLPKYPALPATLLARLAIDKNHQGNNLGELLLIDALQKSFKASKEIGSLAVIVEAKNKKAIDFYQHYGFIQFANHKKKLFLTMKTIKKLFQ